MVKKTMFSALFGKLLNLMNCLVTYLARDCFRPIRWTVSLQKNRVQSM